MKKPSFTAAMAANTPEVTVAIPLGASAISKPKDDRINTTLRISPEGLEALKNVAAAKRIRVNDLLLEGAELVLSLNGRKMQLRK